MGKKIKQHSYAQISQSPFDFLTRGTGKKHLQKSRSTLMKGEKGRGKYLTLPGRERNEFAVFNSKKKTQTKTLSPQPDCI